jgi:hypothetical protein
MLALNSRQAALLIVEKTGRSCTRQNLEQLVQKGRLPKSTISAKPIRVNGDLLIDEYLAAVDTRQANATGQGPKPKTPRPERPKHQPVLPPASKSSETMPDYNESRAREVFEKANLLELERKTKEGLLLKREDVERAQAEVTTIVKTKFMGVATRARQRIPHLTLEEIEVLNHLIRETLQEIADA